MRFEEQQGTGRKGLSLSVRPSCGELTSVDAEHGRDVSVDLGRQPRTGAQMAHGRARVKWCPRGTPMFREASHTPP